MAQVTTRHYDPYKNFKFRIFFGTDLNKPVAGVSKISPLKKSTEPATYREGGAPSSQHVTPTVWKYEAVTVERGITQDREFENWANLVNQWDIDSLMDLKNFRKDITIQLLNDRGVAALQYSLKNCWVSEYDTLPELDANGKAIAIEKMVLQCEGWERDDQIKDPDSY